MITKNIIGIWILAFIVIVGGGYYLTSDKEASAPRESQKAEQDVTTHVEELLAGSYEASPLLAFTQNAYEEAIKGEKLVVLYFYASWCPVCRAEFPLMQKVFDELETDDVIGFRVNYNDSDTDENEKSLAREFGVAYQHTKIFVKNGERILKSPETWKEERYRTEIQSNL